jgi:TatD DNase family protein
LKAWCRAIGTCQRFFNQFFMFTDSHCHLNFPELREQLPAVLSAMAEAQVNRALCICTTLEEFEDVHSLAQNHAHLWSTVGVHPDNEGVQEPTLQDLLSRAALPKVVGIGETGLDYYRLGERSVADMGWQRARFSTHIQAARQTDLPLVIHTRSASDDTLAILREEGGFASGPFTGDLPQARGVFHCFTETQAVARAALDMGFYISFSGILTFRNAADLREVAAFVPMDRLLIETDSPYLAPVPYRGKTNSPAYVRFVAQQVAQIKGLAVEAVAEVTAQNFDDLFSRVAHS